MWWNVADETWSYVLLGRGGLVMRFPLLLIPKVSVRFAAISRHHHSDSSSSLFFALLVVFPRLGESALETVKTGTGTCRKYAKKIWCTHKFEIACTDYLDPYTENTMFSWSAYTQSLFTDVHRLSYSMINLSLSFGMWHTWNRTNSNRVTSVFLIEVVRLQLKTLQCIRVILPNIVFFYFAISVKYIINVAHLRNSLTVRCQLLQTHSLLSFQQVTMVVYFVILVVFFNHFLFLNVF